jgi:hypothetical protein
MVAARRLEYLDQPFASSKQVRDSWACGSVVIGGRASSTVHD